MSSKHKDPHIEEFLAKNGNKDFSQKEMILYLTAKVDKMYDILTEGEGKIAANREAIDSIKCDNDRKGGWYMWLFGGAFSLCMFTLGLLIHHLAVAIP